MLAAQLNPFVAVYLVQRAYPMLPPALSETICSLTPGEDKLTFSVVFTMSADAKIISTWFGKTVIKCAIALPLLAIR